MIQGRKKWTPVEVYQDPETMPYCTGTNGPVGVNCKAAVCNGTNGPKDGPVGTPCVHEEPASMPKHDHVSGQKYQTTGNLTPTMAGEYDNADGSVGNVITHNRDSASLKAAAAAAATTTAAGTETAATTTATTTTTTTTAGTPPPAAT